MTILTKLLRATLAGILITLGGAGNVAAQRPAAQRPAAVSHVALYVFNLKKSVDFYQQVLGLQPIPEPFKDGKHVWLRMGPHSQLHIIEGAARVEPHDKNSHLAFSVKDLKQFTARLDNAGIRYASWSGDEKSSTARPDGIEQVYLQDPDNFWIEVNNDPF